MTTSATTWVLIADSAGARIFNFTDQHERWTLQETLKGDGSGHPAQSGNFGPKASEHKGALRNHKGDNPKESQERAFAHTLAHVLELGHASHAFSKLVLVAPPKLLGDLRENLNRGLQSAVVTEVNKDYTHENVDELMKVLGPQLGGSA